jgi:hypothetical protein
MSWEPGRERVRELIDAGEVEQVTSDLTIARRMLEDAARHLATASQAKVTGDLSGAYQLAYDAYSAPSEGSAGRGIASSTQAATLQALPATTSTMPLPSPPRHAKPPSPSSTRMFSLAGDTGRYGRQACLPAALVAYCLVT